MSRPASVLLPNTCLAWFNQPGDATFTMLEALRRLELLHVRPDLSPASCTDTAVTRLVLTLGDRGSPDGT